VVALAALGAGLYSAAASRLFRQKQIGDWTAVIEEMRSALLSRSE